MDVADATVDLEVNDRVGVVTLNDPARRNALGPLLLDAFHSVWSEVERNREIRSVVLRGAGADFCAGGDISTFDRGVASGRDYVYDVVGAFRRIEHCRKPVIAAVRGRALGGGFELVMACDLVLASETARFALPELSVGAVPAFALVRLGELIGRARAKDLAWSSRRIEPAEAERLGLVAAVVPDEELDEAAVRRAGALAGLPRVAAETVKAAINREVADHALFESTTAAAMLWGTEGIAEGRRAFYEKRAPDFPDE